MRVPVLDNRGILPQDNVSAAPALQQANTQTAQAVEGLGQQVKRSAIIMDQVLDRVRREATATSIAEADAELTREQTAALVGDESSPGFLTTKGNDASAAAGSTAERLKKKADSLAGKFTDPRAKEAWRLHSMQVLTSADRRINEHVAGQREVAKKLSAKEVVDATVSMTMSDPDALDGERLNNAIIAAQAVAPPEAAATVRKDVLSQVYSARVVGYLNHETPDGLAAARETFELQKEFIDEDRRRALDSELTRREVAVAKTQASAGAEDAALSIVRDSHVGTDGMVSEAHINLLLDKVPSEQREATAQAVARVQRRYQEAEKQQLKEWENHIVRFTQGKAKMDANLQYAMDRVELRDPEFFKGLKKDERLEQRALRAERAEWKKLTQEERRLAAEERRDQDRRDESALLAFQKMEGPERAAYDEQGVERWVVGRGVSEDGLNRVKREAMKAREQSEKGVDKERDASISQGLTATKDWFTGRKPEFNSTDKDRLRNFLGREYDKLYEANGKKAPTEQAWGDAVQTFLDSGSAKNYLRSAKKGGTEYAPDPVVSFPQPGTPQGGGYYDINAKTLPHDPRVGDPDAAPSPETPDIPTDMVRVKGPTGAVKTIPRSKVPDPLPAGYQVLP